MSKLVLEQDVAIALELATQGFVLDTGRTVGADTTSALAVSDDIRAAYLGDALNLAS